MKLSSLYNLILNEALEINPLEIEAFIKENDLEDMASVKDGVLHLWRYRIPLNYKRGGVLPPKHLYALGKLFKLIDSMSSKYYEGLFDVSMEEAAALKNLIMKAIMPHNKARELAQALSRNPEKRLKLVYNTYKKIDRDADIIQLPQNLAFMLSAIMDARNPNNRRNYYDENEAQEIQQKLNELKSLSSHTKRIQLFKTAAKYFLDQEIDRYRYSSEKRVAPEADQLDKSAMNLFIKLEDVKNSSWNAPYAIAEAIRAVMELKKIKAVQHMPSIPLSFWKGIKDLKSGLEYRAPHTMGQYPQIVEWWARNPEANVHTIIDTLAMARRYGQPTRFLNRDLEALKAEHEELTQLSQAEEKKQVFNNDILPLKEEGSLKLEYLDNTYDLKYEGKVMNHCVGSYVEDCKEGRSIIYRIYWDDKHIGTLELGNENYSTVTLENAYIRQAYGKYNRKLPAEVNQALEILLKTNRQAKENEAKRAEEAEQLKLQRAVQELGKRELQPEQEKSEFTEPCYECGSEMTEEMRGGQYCYRCGHFERYPEYGNQEDEDW